MLFKWNCNIVENFGKIHQHRFYSNFCNVNVVINFQFCVKFELFSIKSNKLWSKTNLAVFLKYQWKPKKHRYYVQAKQQFPSNHHPKQKLYERHDFTLCQLKLWLLQQFFSSIKLYAVARFSIITSYLCDEAWVFFRLVLFYREKFTVL